MGNSNTTPNRDRTTPTTTTTTRAAPNRDRTGGSANSTTTSTSSSNKNTKNNDEKGKKKKNTVQQAIALDDDSRERFDDTYDRIKLLTKGSSCEIWTVKHKQTQQVMVMKVIPRQNQDFVNEMKNEVDIMKQLDHPNIVRIYNLFENGNDDSIMLVMEFLDGGDLWTRSPYTEAQAAKVLTKILSAIAYLHKLKIVHRDLKMENAIYENTSPDAEPKLIDFGLSKAHVRDNMTCRVGTLLTMSPQVLEGQYTAKADLWSVGCIAYMLLSGDVPFDGTTNKVIVSKIRQGTYSMDGPKWKNVSSSAKAFVKSLLEYDPLKRKSASQALRSSWLQEMYPLSERQPEPSNMSLVRNAITTSTSETSSGTAVLKRLANLIIAHRSSNESLVELRKAFDAMDTNNEGTINFWEFRTALKQSNYSDQQLKEIFQNMDITETGVINYTEFLAATLESTGDIDEALIRQAFQKLDSDKSGYISRDNMCSILGSKCTVQNCQDITNDIMNHVDTDGDGKISFDEFLTLFREKRSGGGDSCATCTS